MSKIRFHVSIMIMTLIFLLVCPLVLLRDVCDACYPKIARCIDDWSENNRWLRRLDTVMDRVERWGRK